MKNNFQPVQITRFVLFSMLFIVFFCSFVCTTNNSKWKRQRFIGRAGNWSQRFGEGNYQWCDNRF